MTFTGIHLQKKLPVNFRRNFLTFFGNHSEPCVKKRCSNHLCAKDRNPGFPYNIKSDGVTFIPVFTLAPSYWVGSRKWSVRWIACLAEMNKVVFYKQICTSAQQAAIESRFFFSRNQKILRK